MVVLFSFFYATTRFMSCDGKQILLLYTTIIMIPLDVLKTLSSSVVSI